MIAITFALPEESSDFVRMVRRRGKLTRTQQGWLRGTPDGGEIVILHTGMGLESAGARTAELLASERPAWLLSSGFAGALNPRLRLGDLVLATNFSAPELLARAGGGAHRGQLVSRARPAELVEEKAALFRETGALAVDMETAAIAEVCKANGVPMLSLRAISDRADEPLPAPLAEWFDLARQRPRPRRLIAYLMRRPSAIMPFVRFVRSLPTARRALTEAMIRSLK